MADIIPFAGIHYDPAKVALSETIAPPYDVLSPAQQENYYAQHPYNFVRIMLNRSEEHDSAAENIYTRAAGFLEEWLKSGVLKQDATPALYEYVQRFEHPLSPEKIVERQTLFVALRVEPYENGVVLPHEETHPKAKADRLNLMRATEANPEPIYGLYEDPTLTIGKSLKQRRTEVPLLKATFTGNSGGTEEHVLYRHADPCLIADVQEYLASRRVWIADGHHRYETALNYQRERRAQETANPDSLALRPYDYLLIGLSAFEDPGLLVLPTHRLVKNVSQDRLDSLALQLERFFKLEEMPIANLREWIKNEVPGEKRFALVSHALCCSLTLRDIALVDVQIDESHCSAWRRLDVTILQTFALDRTLGIAWQELAHTSDVAYTRDEEEAIRKVESGEYQIAFLLQNPTVTEVRDVASAGDKMPQKSTFFFPKLWSGLVMRSLKA